MKNSKFVVFTLALYATSLFAMEHEMEIALRGFDQMNGQYSMDQKDVRLRKEDLPGRVKNYIKTHNPDEPDEYDRESTWRGHKFTPLYDATESDEFIEHTRALLAHKADPDKCLVSYTGDPDKRFYPLSNAIRKNSLRTAILLINSGAKVKDALCLLMDQVCYNDGRQPQLFEGQKILFHALLAKGASLDERDADDETPLMKVVQQKSEAMGCMDIYYYRVPPQYRMYFVAQLLLRGANPHLIKRTGKTAAQLARSDKFIDLAELIEAKK